MCFFSLFQYLRAISKLSSLDTDNLKISYVYCSLFSSFILYNSMGILCFFSCAKQLNWRNSICSFDVFSAALFFFWFTSKIGFQEEKKNELKIDINAYMSLCNQENSIRKHFFVCLNFKVILFDSFEWCSSYDVFLSFLVAFYCVIFSYLFFCEDFVCFFCVFFK